MEKFYVVGLMCSLFMFYYVKHLAVDWVNTVNHVTLTLLKTQKYPEDWNDRKLYHDTLNIVFLLCWSYLVGLLSYILFFK